MTEGITLTPDTGLDGEPPRSKWKRYPSYRDSGVEWLGEIPAHWGQERLKWCVRSIEQGWSPLCENRPAEDDEWGVLKVGCVNGPQFNPDEQKALPGDVEPCPQLEIRPGDVLMSRANTRELLGSASVVGQVRHRLLLCDKLYRLSVLPDVIDSPFLVLSLGSASARFQLERDATGASASMQNISQETVRNVLIPVSPIAEQRAIVRFVGVRTGRLDVLVAKQERLIQLLQEKRAAVISQVVTKGLDPSATMKESGVEWLGEIPAHWKVTRLKYAARLESGHTPNRLTPEYWVDCTIPWVTLNDVAYLKDHDYIHETANYINELGLAGSSARVLPAGTVVLSRDATVGRCGILGRPMATSQHFVDWICGNDLAPEYLLQVFRGPMQQEFLRLTMGATLRTIGMPDVNSFCVPLPPIEEQHQIVTHLAAETARIDALIAKVQEAIDKLKEYRTALISAAVTGKIDLRSEIAQSLMPGHLSQ